MNKIFNAFIVLIAIQSSDAFSQQVVDETVVVTSALVDINTIDKPLYVIDGDEILDGPTSSLGAAIDRYLGISIADYGSAVGQPIIRGMSGSRVKILKNGIVNRDVSFVGADHLNDLDLNDISQIEIVKGPSSLLYANGSIGGIINVVDDCIAQMDFDGAEFAAGYETQSVNDGSTEYFNYKNKVFLGNAGANLIAAYFIYSLINGNYYRSVDVFLVISPFLILGIDMVRLIFLRLLKRTNPFNRDLNHFHHILYRKFNIKITIATYLIISFMPLTLNYLTNVTTLAFIPFQILIYSFIIYRLG